MPPILGVLQAPSRLLPSSSLTHCTHPSLCRYHAKQEAEVLLPAAIAHSPHHSGILLYLLFFADPTSTYSACTPANGFHRVSSTFLFCLLHFILAIDCQASQFKFTKMAYSLPKQITFCFLQDPSLLLSYHVFIEILRSSC